jgi:hypothetical protein
MSITKPSLESNKTVQILKAAEAGKYGVVAPIIYNVNFPSIVT